MAVFPGDDHDHQHCIDEALAEAERLCAQRGRRLTALRRRVLELIWESHQPVKAYDLLARLRDGNASAAPPTVYRTLDFLMAERFVHRLASINAYVGCGHPEHSHNGQFLICRYCHRVAELDDDAIEASLDHRAGDLGFVQLEQTVEIEGICPHCRPLVGDTS
ncbi:Fur family transcriptional regulator [Spiribacter vilamensis]|uniref:Ferric uptake regulation protein n=1 Tax=Spiribacter vilamensis TaxID=531306 RepID=A0A4Q8CYN8_9GAMM|nr:Fur family zinc uptake transcriptional regulator [Spiribacter vilamensis]TVO61045.1 transcriptional repressor [Spiribacter vilamensis]